jgi:hypothetical protein
LRIRANLAEKEATPFAVLFRRDIRLRDVDQLVIHQREDALARRERLERMRQWRDVEYERVLRSGVRERVAVVPEVLQHHDRRFGRRPVEHPALPCERVRERPHRVRRQVVERIVVEEPQVRRGDPRHSDRAFVGGGRNRQQRQ